MTYRIDLKPALATLVLAALAAAPVAAARPQPARAALAERVITRNDRVEVAYEIGGVRLTITGRAEGNAAEGQRFAVRVAGEPALLVLPLLPVRTGAAVEDALAATWVKFNPATNSMVISAIRLCRFQRSIAIDNMKPPRNKKISGWA